LWQGTEEDLKTCVDLSGTTVKEELVCPECQNSEYLIEDYIPEKE